MVRLSGGNTPSYCPPAIRRAPQDAEPRPAWQGQRPNGQTLRQMTAKRKYREWRPGLRAGVLTVCAALVFVTAAAVSITVSDHLAKAAVNEAERHVEAVIRGFVDPMFTGADITDTTPEQAAE